MTRIDTVSALLQSQWTALAILMMALFLKIIDL
jgi:hypothetical protein